MTPQNDQDLKQRLQELEVEVQQNSSSSQSHYSQTNPTSQQPLNSANELLDKLQPVWNQIQTWFNQLPPFGKVLVLLVVAGLTLSLLSTVLHLVSSLIALAVLGGGIFLAYKFLIASKTEV